MSTMKNVTGREPIRKSTRETAGKSVSKQNLRSLKRSRCNDESNLKNTPETKEEEFAADSDNSSEDIDELDRCSPQECEIRSRFQNCEDRNALQKKRDNTSEADSSASSSSASLQSLLTDRAVLQPFPNNGRIAHKFGMLILMSVVVFIIGVIWYYGLSNSSIKKPLNVQRTITDIYSDIREDLKFMHHHLSQSKEFWTQILGQFKMMMSHEIPVQPSVLMLVVPDGAQGTAVCFTSRIGETIQAAFADSRQVMVDVKSYSDWSSDDIKYSIHENLQLLQESHIALIYNLEKLPAAAAMTFHGFCDNLNAPYKRVFFIFTVEIDKQYNLLSSANVDNTVQQHLTNLWINDMTADNISAILSRIAVAPVLLKPENKDVLSSICSISL